MVGLQWLEPFDACQWFGCQIVGWLLTAFVEIHQLLSEVDFFAGQCFVFSDLPLALISQFVCHNCRFLGSLMAQGSVWVVASAVEFLKQHLVFVTMS